MAQAIVPRWEWRTFSQEFSDTHHPFAGLDATEVQESNETYFLSTVTSENVKVRDDLMDIKKLQQVNSDGLEQWKPVMKHGFPLPAEEVNRVFDVLGLAPPELTRPGYTLQQLLDEVIAPVREIRVVKVHKTRTRYTVEGCMGEMAEVSADGKKTGTIALELEDAARVIGTVRKLKLDRFKNISYPHGLKQLVGLPK
jgi:exopolyphosphatase/guanosine-5'-triphosphate,3'-diphosphate pyrophosphatase